MKIGSHFRFIALLITLITIAMQSSCSGLSNLGPRHTDFADYNSDEVANVELNRELLDYMDSIKNFTIVSTDEVIKKIENDDLFFLYTGRITCEWCRKLVPILNEIVIEREITIFYLNSENTEENVELKAFRKDYGIDLVPSIIYFDGSNNYSNIEHNVSSDDFSKQSLDDLIAQYCFSTATEFSLQENH